MHDSIQGCSVKSASGRATLGWFTSKAEITPAYG
jgi:hypothetical protein